MNRYIALILLIVVFILPLHAQETIPEIGSDTETGIGVVSDEFAPEEMELVIPTILLEVEEEKLALIEAPLPGDEERTLATLILPLPDAPELKVSPLEVDTPGFIDLSSIISSPAVSEDEEQEGKDFYSTGLIGGGSGSRILGDITLYKLGKSPRFQIQFFHGGVGAFVGHDAGEGFSINHEKLSGSIELENETNFSETDIKYDELSLGLQGNPDYSSMTLREFFFDTQFKSYLWDSFGLKGGILFDSVDQWLSGATPPRFSGMTLAPEAAVFYENDIVDLELEASYKWDSIGITNNSSSHLHGISGHLKAEMELSGGIDIIGDAGIFWEPGALPLYPLLLTLQGEPSGTLFFYSSLEMVAEQPSMVKLWRLYPWLKPETLTGGALDISPLTGWRGVVHGRFIPFSFVTLNGEVSYKYYDNGFIPLVTDGDGLSPLSRGEINALFSEVSLDFILPYSLGVSAGWRGQLIFDGDPFEPTHRINGELSWLPGEMYGASLSGKLDIYGMKQPVFTTQWVPEVGFSGYISITNGIQLMVEGEDLLSPLLGSGRLVWDNYEDTGFALTFKLGISL
ncbi:MAG: hypothetical protein JEY99_19770 [Spirochaetales bacterium]|nr:hypothetical protein [Spirochaetales bacterium]